MTLANANETVASNTKSEIFLLIFLLFRATSLVRASSKIHEWNNWMLETIFMSEISLAQCSPRFYYSFSVVLIFEINRRIWWKKCILNYRVEQQNKRLNMSSANETANRDAKLPSHSLLHIFSRHVSWLSMRF